MATNVIKTKSERIRNRIFKTIAQREELRQCVVYAGLCRTRQVSRITYVIYSDGKRSLRQAIHFTTARLLLVMYFEAKSVAVIAGHDKLNSQLLE